MNAGVQKRKRLWLERFGCGRERTRKPRVVWLSEGCGGMNSEDGGDWGYVVQ